MLIGIVEDDVHYLELLKRKLDDCKQEEDEIRCYSDSQSFNYDITNQKLEFDILLLDIEIGKENGIDLALKVNEITPYTQIIYITAYMQYVSDVYQSKHTYFIDKEKLDKYFPQAIKKAKENINHLKSQYLYISWNKQKNEVYQKDIIYIERKSRVSYVYTKKEVYKTSLKINDLILLLNDTFCICHKSFIVHMDYIKDIKHNSVQINNNQILPISRSQKDHFKQIYNRYILVSK